jgi:hypothetical protein
MIKYHKLYDLYESLSLIYFLAFEEIRKYLLDKWAHQLLYLLHIWCRELGKKKLDDLLIKIIFEKCCSFLTTKNCSSIYELESAVKSTFIGSPLALFAGCLAEFTAKASSWPVLIWNMVD